MTQCLLEASPGGADARPIRHIWRLGAPDRIGVFKGCCGGVVMVEYVAGILRLVTVGPVGRYVALGK
jgi:hypothetical protein